MRWLLTILYGLLVIWTGLWRNIEAQAYKPNALWFCFVVGLAAIAAGFLYRMNRRLAGGIIASVVAGVALAFYLYCFIAQAEKDATFRVGLVIIASIGQLVIVLVPNAADTAVALPATRVPPLDGPVPEETPTK